MHGIDTSTYAYGLWTLVIFNVLLVILFIASFLRPRKKVEWRSFGAFTAFIIALFFEMYGFPLTIYLLTTLFGARYPVANPFSHANGHLILVLVGLSDSVAAMTILHIITNAIIIAGFYVIYKGWKLIHEAKSDELVTNGIYAHIRHPQYDGMFLITIGLLIQWPSVTSLIMWPILMFAYYRLAKREERTLERQFGKKFLEYKERVPAFIPRRTKT